MSALTYLLERKILSKIALTGFLLSLPLSVRKVFFVFSVDGSARFNEYTDISLYLSDVFFLILLINILLEYKCDILSILSKKSQNKLFHVEQLGVNSRKKSPIVPRGTISEFLSNFFNCSTWNNWIAILVVPLPLVLWSAISIYWSESQMLSIYAFFKVFEGYILYCLIVFLIVPRGTIRENRHNSSHCSTWNNGLFSHIIFKINQLFHVEQLKSRQYDEIHTDKIVPRGTIKRISDNVFDNCSTWNNYRIIFKTLIFGGFLQAIIGIIQFFSQSSIGITFLQESVFSAQEAGIAKIILLGSQIVRPYGLLPHPNLLAFFLGITILITVAYPLLFRKNLFHVEQLVSRERIVPRGTILSNGCHESENCSTWNNWYIKWRMFHVEQFSWAYRGIIFVQVFCFLVTFSKSAYIGLLLSLSLLFYKLFHVEQLGYKMENVPRGTILSRIWRAIQQCSTWNKSTASILKNTVMFHVEHYLWVGVFIFMIILAFIFGRGLDWQYFIVQPINERLFLFQEIIPILKDKPVTGVGIGQSVLLMQDFFSEKLEVWQFQPIHNLFLLIGSELGITGLLFLVIFVYFIGRTLFSKKYVPRGTYARFRHWFLNTCSTWNIAETFLIIKYKKMLHVEHFSNARDTYFLQSLLQSLFLFFGVVAFFDHYLWDIQQGQLLFWLLMAIFARFSIIRTIDK